MIKVCVLGIAILFACGPNEGRAQQQQHPDDNPKPTVTVNASPASGQQTATNVKAPELRAAAEWANWLIVLLTTCTLIVIICQTIATAKSAAAAEKSAKAAERAGSALENSERAWVMVEAKFPLGAGPLSTSGGINDGFTITDFEVIVENAGRTPAWVYEQVVQMSVSKLPPVPEFDSTAERNSGIYPIVQNQPATTWKPYTKAKGIPDLDGQPYIFGVVRYRDSFSDSRETYFGYIVKDWKRLERLPNPAFNKYT